MDERSVYFDRSEPIGVESVMASIDDAGNKEKLLPPDRSFVLASACFLEARDGMIGEHTDGEFLKLLKKMFESEAGLALATVHDLVVYIPQTAEWKRDEVFGEGAMGKPAVIALWGEIADGLEKAWEKYKLETSYLEKLSLGSVIGSVANDLSQRMMIEGETKEEEAEIGPEKIWVPKEAGRKLEVWLNEPGVEKLARETKAGLIEEVKKAI